MTSETVPQLVDVKNRKIWVSKLDRGDDLEVLHRRIQDEEIDLDYLELPVERAQNYYVLAAEQARRRAAATPVAHVAEAAG